MKKNLVLEKSFDFAVRIVNLKKYLVSEKKEYVLSKQVLRSGTAIGALVREAQQAESNADFIHKFSIALKEEMKLNIGCCYSIKLVTCQAINLNHCMLILLSF